MNQKQQPFATHLLPWPAIVLALAVALIAASPAWATDPELNPERGGSDIDLALLGPGQGNGPTPVRQVHEQLPQMPQNPFPSPVMVTGLGWDADRVYNLCLQNPDRTDVNCIDFPPGGFEHAAAGTGLRNTGEGSIQLRGIPSGAVPIAAWLYWGMVASSEDPQGDLATVYFDNVEINGTQIGTCAEPCWEPAGGAEFYAYRASVLRLLPARVNGIYSVRTRLSSITDGTDPWLNTGLPPWSEGASLVVIYSEAGVPAESKVYISHGAALLKDAIELDHDLDPALADGVCGFRHTRVGGDGQTSWEEQSLIPYNTQLGIAGNLATIRGPASDIDPDQDWQGSDGGPKNQLWDTHTSELAGAQVPGLTSGATTYRVRYEPHTSGGPFKDCVAVVMHALTAFADGQPES